MAQRLIEAPRNQAERARLAKARLSRVGPLHSWQILLAAIPVLSTVYLLLPESSAARTVAYPAFVLLAMVAVLVGVHRRRPVRAGSWWLIALGLALLSIGDSLVKSINDFWLTKAKLPQYASKR